MTSQNGSPAATPSLDEQQDTPFTLPRLRSPEKAVRPASDYSSIRRSNPSLSALFASTSIASANKRASSPALSTPAAVEVQESAFNLTTPVNPLETQSDYKSLLLQSYVPHVAVLSSSDTEELLAQKGFTGGLLELIRPYGEHVQGKVTIRDISGASKSWEDYAIRFVKLKDGLDSPRLSEHKSTDSGHQNINGILDRVFPHSSARLRTGGDISQVEEAVDKHMVFSDVESAEREEIQGPTPVDQTSPFHHLYLRRLLSGLPMSPHETFSHPVACVIAISSRNPDPIEELRQLYASTNTGEERLPEWVNNEYLRYYVLVHDEEHDDTQRAMMLFDQMKRHFGLHCHLLRLRGSQCVPSDDDYERLPECQWISAAEELSEIQRRENLDDVEFNGPCLYESDATSVRSFVRELVTQSIVPVMERLCATWNDQVVSRRKGLSGRFLSLSKKWAPFGTSSRSSSASNNPSGSNYDSVQGFYKPDAPEAIMRKLGDYAFMLRDFKLAQTTYDLVRSDFSNDKAWKYSAGAHEMSAITSLMNPAPLTAKSRVETVDQMLETACYSYITRCTSPFYSLRALAVAIELLLVRGGSSADDAARWSSRILELELVGPIGHALYAEKVAACYFSTSGSGSQHWGARGRKAALWSFLACESWLQLDKIAEAEQSLSHVFRLYSLNPHDALSSPLAFEDMRTYLLDLREALAERKGAAVAMEPGIEEVVVQKEVEEPVDEASEKLDLKSHRYSFVEGMPSRLSIDTSGDHERVITDKPDIRTHRKSLIGLGTTPVSGNNGEDFSIHQTESPSEK